METQYRAVLEVLWDFCESGDVHTLVRGDSTVLPETCTSMAKVGFYIMIKQLKKTMPWLNKQGVETLKHLHARHRKALQAQVRRKHNGNKRRTHHRRN